MSAEHEQQPDEAGTEAGAKAAADNYPHGIKLALIMGSSYLSMFLVALVSTGIPLGSLIDHHHVCVPFEARDQLTRGPRQHRM